MPTKSISPNGQLEPRAHAPAGGLNLIASFNNGIVGQTTTSFASAAKVMHGEEASAHTATTTLYHGNQQYSVTAISDSSGNVSERYAYTAYGQPTFLNASGAVQTSSAASNRYTYTGREWDSTLGLLHFRARWMSGLSGRFLTRDPIGFKGSPYDLYEFLDSKAVFGVDPKGQRVEICCRATAIPILGNFGFPHCWLKTDTESCGRGTIPGKCSNSCPCSLNQQVDHTGQTGECKPPEEVHDAEPYGGDHGAKCGHRIVPGSCNEGCINSELDAGKPVPGRFFPFVNDCHSFVMGVLKKCCQYEWIDPAYCTDPSVGGF